MSSADSPQIQPNLDSSVAGLGKDENLQKVRERDERLRIARERLKEEQRRKLEELRETIQRAEEVLRKQEECRRQRIEETKRRNEQHQASVEERRKKLLDEENERKQAIVRKTEAKLEQTKQKKISGTSVAIISACSSALNVVQSEPLRTAECRSSRNLESIPYENNAPAVGRKTNVSVKRKRLSSSVDQVARIRAAVSENQAYKQEVEPPNVEPARNGSPSPVASNRTKSTGNVRKSRADLRKTPDSLQATVNGKAAPAEQTRNLASTRTGISKSVSSAEALDANATLKSAAKSPTVSRASALAAKFIKPQMFSTPPAKLQPSPPKTLASRSLPKPLKDTSSNRYLTSSKGIVRAVHDLAIHIQPLQSDKKKELPPSDASGKQKGACASGEPSSEDTFHKTSKISVEEEYKLKLAENRRLAREKLEREVEEVRQRVEDERRKEEERQRLEEEEQRKREEEELRAVEEARKQEEERFRLAVEETERQRKEEEDKEEAEQQEKLAAEKKAQEEAERKEKERLEKSQREEDERQERKKRIETIMKRVKTDDNPQKDVKEVKAVEPVGGDRFGMKFLSPLLRQIMGSKFRGKAASESPPATSESSNDESEVLKSEAPSDGGDETQTNDAPSESSDAVKTNLDELLDETSEASLEAVNKDPGTRPRLSTCETTNGSEGSGADSNISLTTSPSNEKAASHATESNVEVIDLSSLENKVTKASDDNQNWAIPAKQHPDATNSMSEQSLPDLPRIAFDENTAKNSQNQLPDILL